MKHYLLTLFCQFIGYPTMNLMFYPFIWHGNRNFRHSLSKFTRETYEKYRRRSAQGMAIHQDNTCSRVFERMRKNLPVGAAAALLILVHENPFETGGLVRTFLSESLSRKRTARRLVKGHLRDFYSELLQIEELSNHEKNIVLENLNKLDD